MMAQVDKSDTGMVTLGMSVARTWRRNTNMPSTTRPLLTAMVNWTSPTDALIVWVRSPSTCSLIEGGSERCRFGSTSLTRCTVSLML